MDSLRTLRLWAAAAWADGKLHPSEAEALRRLLDASDDLTPAERAQAERFLERPPQIDLAEVRALGRNARQGVYRAALRIVRLDRVITDDEKEFLAGLRAHLDLDEATILRLEAEAESEG